MNRKGKILLVAALVAVVGMAFRVSWNALHDVAMAVGADADAATLYPFVVDGLMALALVATLVLTDDARRFALRVLAGYTAASLVLNFVHGLVPELHGASVDWGRLSDWEPVNFALVLLATSLPVGSIYFGSDLVAKVLHHQPDTTTDANKSTQIEGKQSTSDLGESTSEASAAVAELPAAKAADLVTPTARERILNGLGLPTEPIPAVAHTPRRPTGRVPASARTPRPTRTPEQLLSEARMVTVDWTDGQLTAEGIRKAVRTSADKARGLRDTLRAERQGGTDAAAA